MYAFSMVRNMINPLCGVNFGGGPGLFKTSTKQVDNQIGVSSYSGVERMASGGDMDFVSINHNDLFLKQANGNYPRFILGGDKFLDYWGPRTTAELATTGGVYAIMSKAYELGIRGFDISPNDHVIEAFKELKSAHQDAVAIGNPNWRCGIKLGDTIIYDLSSRFRKTLLAQCFATEQLEEIQHLPGKHQKRWFSETKGAEVLTPDEIRGLHLDESLYRSKLERLAGIVDYALIGTDYADWLIPIGREDILARMSEITQEYGFAPLSISHWPSVTLPVLDQMDFGGHWIYLNKTEQFLSARTAESAILKVKHPVTAFRVLGGGKLIEDLAGAFTFLKGLGVNSVVIGAEKNCHLETTMPVLKSVYDVHQ